MGDNNRWQNPLATYLCMSCVQLLHKAVLLCERQRGGGSSHISWQMHHSTLSRIAGLAGGGSGGAARLQQGLAR